MQRPWHQTLTESSRIKLSLTISSRARRIAVVMNYRRYPFGASVMDQAEDVGLALDWVRREVQSFNGDPENIVLIGHSSGAHISALHLLLSETPKPPQHFVSLCAPLDITKHYNWEVNRGVHEISALKPANSFSGESESSSAAAAAVRALEINANSAFAESSPTLITAEMDRDELWARMPPVVRLFHAKDDTTVSAASTSEFHKELTRFDDAEGGGADTKFILDEVGGHGGIIVDFMLGNSDASSSTSTIQGIIKNII